MYIEEGTQYLKSIFPAVKRYFLRVYYERSKNHFTV